MFCNIRRLVTWWQLNKLGRVYSQADPVMLLNYHVPHPGPWFTTSKIESDHGHCHSLDERSTTDHDTILAEHVRIGRTPSCAGTCDQ